jgi:hypothetical protein
MQTWQTDLNEPPCELVEEEGVPQSSASSPIGMIGEEEEEEGVPNPLPLPLLE